MENILEQTETGYYAWALIPNHCHLLLQTGTAPIATVMLRLLTGHAICFNRRHRCSGHLFQNRYKSILCQEDTYLLELVRYIHLNPLRAESVIDMDALEKYPFSGHGVILKKNQVHLKSDERILGDGDFVEKSLCKCQEAFEQQYTLKAQGVDLDYVVDRVAKFFGMKSEHLWMPGKSRQQVTSRSLLCFWAVRELGESMVSPAKRLNISTAAVSKSVARGAEIADREGYELT